MKIIVFLLLLVATNAHATDSFSDRVTKARRAEHMLENRPALTSFMNETMGKSETAMSNCFKNTPPPTFTLVADLMPGGHIANVAIEPLTPALECYQNAYQKITFKTSIPERYSSTGLPIFIRTTFNDK